MNRQEYPKASIGFLDLLTTTFIALKLSNHIDWSWVWVLSPTWIPILVVVILTYIINKMD